MRSIFLKIFLCFLLTMALVSATSFVIAIIFIRNNAQEVHREDFVISSLNFYEQTALEKLINNGNEAFIEYLTNLEKTLPLRLSVYNNENKIIYKQNTPSQIIDSRRLEDLAKKNTENNENCDIHFVEDRLFVSKTVLTSNTSKKEKLFFLWDVAINRPHFANSHLFYQILRSLLALSAIGLVCYFLSRYLTSPIIKLSLATREFANGNWQARVGKSLGSRRDELTELATDFDDMAEKICSLIDSQKRLISDVSHELRSPLARLNVALSLARKRSGEKAFSALDRIELESERLNDLIEQILTLARLESDKTLSFTPINLTELVKEVAEDASFEAQSKECNVVTQLKEVSIIADKNLIHSTVDNILRNAIRHTKENSIVQVSLGYEEGFGRKQAIIEVQDQGEGVPESDLTEIFKPFYRVDYARERDKGGSGLGLAIVAQAVKLHKGKVTAKNLASGGLKISISLPLNPKELT
ncbi:MAG: HAMP domain-containing protein [Acidobacteria bacterium]|nr:HAMP domain-containing protein [Acidobacteriota bacterium]